MGQSGPYGLWRAAWHSFSGLNRALWTTRGSIPSMGSFLPHRPTMKARVLMAAEQARVKRMTTASSMAGTPDVASGRPRISGCFHGAPTAHGGARSARRMPLICSQNSTTSPALGLKSEPQLPADQRPGPRHRRLQAVRQAPPAKTQATDGRARHSNVSTPGFCLPALGAAGPSKRSIAAVRRLV